MVKAKKRFGQNFLKNQKFVDKIIESMSKEKRIIVEIGPGLGDLTKKLLVKRDKVKAFEVDRDLCKILKKQFKTQIDNSQLELNCIDVLEAWSCENLIGKEYDLIANLPYYIATKIILKALNDTDCKNIIVMVQKEVALKFCAKSGEKEFSPLSIFANMIGNAKILFEVPPEAFEPPPKVTSAVILISKEKNFYETNGKFKDKKEFLDFQNFLKTAFSSPRKTLIKNLSSKFDKTLLNELFKKCAFKSTIRPHQLKISDYCLIFNNLKGKIYGEREK